MRVTLNTCVYLKQTKVRGKKKENTEKVRRFHKLDENIRCTKLMIYSLVLIFEKIKIPPKCNFLNIFLIMAGNNFMNVL